MGGGDGTGDHGDEQHHHSGKEKMVAVARHISETLEVSEETSTSP